MKILFITNHLDVGGIEKNIVRLTRELTKRGDQVTTASNPGGLVRELIEVGGTHFPLPVSKRPSLLWRSTRSLAALIRTDRPDVIHVFSASGAVVLRLARLWLRLSGGGKSPPMVASIMGLVNSPDESSIIMRLRVLLTALGAKRLIVVAPAIDDVVRSLPIREKRLARMSVVGVEVPSNLEEVPRLAVSTREELGIDPTAKVVTTVGRLDPSKSHHLFVSAAELATRVRDGIVFLIVGDGPLREELESQIIRSGLGSTVRLLGERHDIGSILAASDVCVRPGIVEGFIGITVLEAQAVAVPVVAFATQDVRLAIKDGETGCLVPPEDVQALADAIIELLDDQDRARVIGTSGRDRMMKEYSIDLVVDRLRRLYSELS